MDTFTKLFGSIVRSTVWQEPDETRIIWFALLALADGDGVIISTIPGLAHTARISLDGTKRALDRFKQPDEYSRTQDFEGRRIEDVEGGWRLLNHAKYRALMSYEERKEYNRKKQAEWRAKNSAKVETVSVKECQTFVKECQSQHTEQRAKSAHTESDSESDSKKEQKTTLVAAQREKVASLPKNETATAETPIALRTQKFETAWAEWSEYRKERRLSAYKPLGARKQLQKLAELGEDRAIVAIEFSIRQNYQGIFEEKQNGGFGQKPQKRAGAAIKTAGARKQLDALFMADGSLKPDDENSGTGNSDPNEPCMDSGERKDENGIPY